MDPERVPLDDFDPGDDGGYLDAYEEALSECGMGPDGYCGAAGSEWCEFECPLGRVGGVTMADAMQGLSDMLKRVEERREADAARFAALAEDECQLCGAAGEDKRSLFVSCFYQVQEAVPEAIDLARVERLKDRGYYLRICKECRGRFLGALRGWADDCRAKRGADMDHDGHLQTRPEGANIPVRVDGRIVYMTEAEWYARRDAQERDS